MGRTINAIILYVTLFVYFLIYCPTFFPNYFYELLILSIGNKMFEEAQKAKLEIKN